MEMNEGDRGYLISDLVSNIVLVGNSASSFVEILAWPKVDSVN